MGTTEDLICFHLPAWISFIQGSEGIVKPAANAAQEAQAVDSNGSSFSLFGALSSFMIGWQVTNYGLAEGFTRLSEKIKGKGPTAKELSIALWAIGVFFGRLGFGRPTLEAKREREKIEKSIKTREKLRANIDRPIEDADIGRYVRYKCGNERGIGLMVGFDKTRNSVTVKHMIDETRFVVDMRTVSFVSDEEKRRR